MRIRVLVLFTVLLSTSGCFLYRTGRGLDQVQTKSRERLRPELVSLSGNESGDDREGTPSNLAELIALRKLRQSTRKEGIDLERLNSVNKKRKKKKVEDPADSYGLQSKGGLAVQDER